jgi:hypothetical protein
MYDVITWFDQPDGRTKLYLTTRDRVKAEKAVHVFAGLINADVVELKPDKNGLYEVTLRLRMKAKAPSIIQAEGKAHQEDDENLAGGEKHE